MPIGSNYSGVGPARGVAFVFYISLVSQANTKIFQVNPTIAAGDFKVAIDDGDWNNLATLPAVVEASPATNAKRVKVSLSASEMDGDNVCVLASDQSGAEWCDRMIDIQTSTGAAQQMLVGTVDDTVAPSTTEFETSDITEATANHFLGRAVVFLTGSLAGQAATVEAYALSSGRGHFTVSPMTEAPANGDKFVMV